MIPKIIHLTYKHAPPMYVLDRWRKLNPDYTIDFSLDADCLKFMKENCSPEVVRFYQEIGNPMYMSDLWRLVKLYKEGGVYADIDLVPYVPLDELFKDSYSLYSNLSAEPNSIFQALLATTPKNPIILKCIESFLTNRPYLAGNGPTRDMYSVFAKILEVSGISSERPYFTVVDGEPHTIYLFTEHLGDDLFYLNQVKNAYVTWSGKKIIGCRDPEYFNAKRFGIEWT
jgi:hypothetical protein